MTSAVVLSIALALSAAPRSCMALQTWVQQPRYQEVNPGEEVTLACVVSDISGKCRWEKDGKPVDPDPIKYQWVGSPEAGDCSFRVLNAELEYDDGVWQCQVPPTSYKLGDSLISEGAQLVVRQSPDSIQLRRIGADGVNQTAASAGEDVELECVVEGGNPASRVRWFARDQELSAGHIQENIRQKRTWRSVSRLTLPVSKADNGAVVTCAAEHPALKAPLTAKTTLTIHYPPSVRIETSRIDYLEEEKDPASLRCVSDANPPATVLWRKKGLAGIFSPDPEINFSPVTRHTAGIYSCTAENNLGMSKAKFVELDVKFGPSILDVGPSKVVVAKIWNRTILTCEAEGNPAPRYQWLQKRRNEEVSIRGNEKTLIIPNVTYDHQGEFVCKAANTINGEERSVQSEPIVLEVNGAPQVIAARSPLRRRSHVGSVTTRQEVTVRDGEDARLEVFFCSDPLPKQTWHLGDQGSGAGHNVILSSGIQHGRFFAEMVRKSELEDCYISALKINGAHADDSHGYQLSLSNDHGTDTHTVYLVVRDHVSQESLIAVGVGAILTLLLLILILIYCCKSSSCCCAEDKTEPKKGFKPADIESDRTDVESTHSSNMSGYPTDKVASMAAAAVAAIPPDALYGGGKFGGQQQHQFVHDSVFNDSKESLRPHLMPSSSASPAPLNDSRSSTPDDLNTSGQQKKKVSYHDLCFPKTSNYGSMKKKKSSKRQNNVGVDCRLDHQTPPPPPSYYTVNGQEYARPSRADTYVPAASYYA